MAQAQQTQRLRALAAISWAKGLSYRSLEKMFVVSRMGIGHIAAWCDVLECAEQLRKKRMWKRVRVLGVDGAYVRGMGKAQPVVVVDLGNGELISVAAIDEANPQAVKRCLGSLVKQLEVRVIVTDDLMQYKTVADQLEVEHQSANFMPGAGSGVL